MEPLEELLAKHDDLTDSLESIAGKMADVETDEELDSLKEKYDAKEKELDSLEEDIARAKSLADRKQKMRDVRNSLPDNDVDGKTTAPEGDDNSSGGQPGESASSSGEGLELPEEGAKNISVSPDVEREHIKMFTDYMSGKHISQYSDREREFLHPDSDNFEQGKEGVRMPRSWFELTFGKRVARSFETYRRFGSKAISSADTDDAYLVDTDYMAELLQLEPEPGHLLGRVTVVPVQGGQVDIPRLQQTDSNEYGGMSFSWKDEGASKDEAEPTIEQVSITCHEVSGYTEITKTMARRNTVAATAIVQRLYRQGMQDAMDDVIISGSGTGQPAGIVNATGVRTQARDTSGDVKAKDAINLKHAILAHHNGIFIVHDEVEQALEIDDLSTENPILGDGVLAKKPYEVTERQPEKGNDGDMIYGDPANYYLGMEQDVVVEQSGDYKFREGKLAFAVYAVLGGQLALPRGMAILQSTTS